MWVVYHDGRLVKWNTRTKKKNYIWETNQRLHRVKITKDKSKIVVVGNYIEVLNTGDRKIVWDTKEENQNITYFIFNIEQNKVIYSCLDKTIRFRFLEDGKMIS